MKRKRCAYLTMDSTEGWSIDADLSFGPMRDLGWSIDMVPWRSAGTDWNAYDAVYICTPWDYPDDPDRFLELLGAIDESQAVLVNDISLVRWSMPKTYLRDLESRGADIVPSLWHDALPRDWLSEFFDRHRAARFIIKPVVSTNANNTFLVERDLPAAVAGQIERVFAARPFVVQAFIESVRTEGEFSLFHFANRYSHAILKTPKPGDFRVQEEHGARIVAVDPEPALRQAAANVLSLVEPAPVYARSDFLRGPDGRFLLMELELVEPSLYFRMDRAAPERFARAFDAYVARRRASASDTGR